MSAPVFQSYPLNTEGRDFVLGDIHGAYDLVIQGMRNVKFDRSVDRIFSVGDLIDRGPQSHRALEFLAQPYMFSIYGNHEEQFCSLDLHDIRTLGKANWHGMKWVNDVSDEKLLALKQAFSKLPVAIEVQTRRGSVGLVHGDVPVGMTWQAFVQALQRGDEHVRDTALTGRNRLKTGDDSGVSGIGRVFVGHTVQWNGAKRLGNVYAIDTGAVFRELYLDRERGFLSMMNLACQTQILGTITEEQLVQSRFAMTHAEEAEGSFGDYAAAPAPR